MRVTVWGLSLLGALALALAGTASGAALPSAVADGGTPHHGKSLLVRPGQIVYTGDGSGFLAGPGKGGRHPKPGKLKWSTWTGGVALGSGADWLNDCEPFCAAGSFSQHPVTIKLYRPRKLLGFSVFTRMTVHYVRGPNPFTHKRTETFTLSAVTGRQLFWNIPS